MKNKQKKEKKAQKGQKEQEYRERIVEKIGEIENVWILGQILQFIQNMTKED